MRKVLKLHLYTDALLSAAFQGLLRMKVLPRLRYILEVVRPSPPVVQDVLEILTRFCRHSSTSATQVATQTNQTPSSGSSDTPRSPLTSSCVRPCFSAQVLDCPRLMNVLLSEFLPTSWAASSSSPPQTVYGLPLSAAMKLLRVLATSGRHACARLVSVSVQLVCYRCFSGFKR